MSAAGTPAKDAPGELLFLFTVDTEVHLDAAHDVSGAEAFERAIYCRLGGRDCGIGLIMDLLDARGFVGTFFVDVLMEHRFGREVVQRAVHAIRERGHDVQLHLHTAPHLSFAADPALRELNDALVSHDPERFRGALEAGMESFVAVAGHEPAAYRSGGYQLSDGYLDVLGELGIAVDSSLWPFKGCRTSTWMWPRSQPFWVGDVLEVPVSYVVERRRDGEVVRQFGPRRAGAGAQSAITSFPVPDAGSPRTLVYLCHSYSFMQSRDDPAEGLDEPRLALAERMLDELAARADVRGIGFGELATMRDRWPKEHPEPAPAPHWDQLTSTASSVRLGVADIERLRDAPGSSPAKARAGS